MIKLLDLLKEDNPFVSRGGEKRAENFYKNKIQQYVKDGMKGDLDLSNSLITSLPDELTKVGGDLYLSFTKITSLPNNLTVGGDLDLSLTNIISLPSELRVGGNLYLLATPLSEKYSEKEIRAMVPNVNGGIIIKYSTI